MPAYNPTVVYGSYPATPYYPWYSYPSSYWYPTSYYPAGAGLVAFGVGMAWGAAVWGGCNWGSGDIDVNVNRNTNINNINGKWEHNASHRQGVRYKDGATRNRYDQASRNARNERCGGLTINSDNSFFAEYDLFCPHPQDTRWFVEMVTAWGREESLRCEAKLIPSFEGWRDE